MPKNDRGGNQPVRLGKKKRRRECSKVGVMRRAPKMSLSGHRFWHINQVFTSVSGLGLGTGIRTGFAEPRSTRNHMTQKRRPQGWRPTSAVLSAQSRRLEPRLNHSSRLRTRNDLCTLTQKDWAWIYYGPAYSLPCKLHTESLESNDYISTRDD